MKKDLVVIINGAGTNGSELRALYRTLVKNENYFVYYPGIMPGAFVGTHFPKVKVKDFKVFIDSTLEIINQKEWNKVYVIGYSLGCSTTAILSNLTDNIDKLVFVAPIVKNPNYSKFVKGLAKRLRHPEDLTRVQNVFYNEFVKRFIKVPKIHIWYLQLYFKYTKKFLKVINKPLLVIETLHDEVVKKKSIDQIEKRHKNELFERYPINSSHFLFFDKKVRDEVIKKIDLFIKEE